MKKISIIGYGALGKILTRAVLEKLEYAYEIAGIYDQAKIDAPQAGAKPIHVYTTFEELLKNDADIVVEIAGVGAVRAYGQKVLAAKKDLIITSVGALADDRLYVDLRKAAEKNGRRIHIPSGAVGGFDIIRTIALMGGADVEIESTKAPKSLNGAPYLEERVLPADEKREIFAGDARAAIAGFPKNTNVAVATAITGVGVEKTRVRIISDPEAAGNTHRIHAENERAAADIAITSKPDPANPKSSVTAAWSVAALLADLASPVRFF